MIRLRTSRHRIFVTWRMVGAVVRTVTGPQHTHSQTIAAPASRLLPTPCPVGTFSVPPVPVRSRWVSRWKIRTCHGVSENPRICWQKSAGSSRQHASRSWRCSPGSRGIGSVACEAREVEGEMVLMFDRRLVPGQLRQEPDRYRGRHRPTGRACSDVRQPPDLTLGRELVLDRQQEPLAQRQRLPRLDLRLCRRHRRIVTHDTMHQPPTTVDSRHRLLRHTPPCPPRPQPYTGRGVGVNVPRGRIWGVNVAGVSPRRYRSTVKQSASARTPSESRWRWAIAAS